MAKLTKLQQTFIIQQLACFRSQSEIVDAVKETFGLAIDRQHVFYYDQTRRTNEKWKAIFEATRQRFLEEISEIPIANQAYRLRELQAMYDAQKRQTRQNEGLKKEILEQAAKESGGQFTNKQKHEHAGKDGKPIQTETRVILPPAPELPPA